MNDAGFRGEVRRFVGNTEVYYVIFIRGRPALGATPGISPQERTHVSRADGYTLRWQEYRSKETYS